MEDIDEDGKKQMIKDMGIDDFYGAPAWVYQLAERLWDSRWRKV